MTRPKDKLQSFILICILKSARIFKTANSINDVLDKRKSLKKLALPEKKLSDKDFRSGRSEHIDTNPHPKHLSNGLEDNETILKLVSFSKSRKGSARPFRRHRPPDHNQASDCIFSGRRLLTRENISIFSLEVDSLERSSGRTGEPKRSVIFPGLGNRLFLG